MIFLCRAALHAALFVLTTLPAFAAVAPAPPPGASTGKQTGLRTTTYNVGSARVFKTLNAVLPNLKPGDVVAVDPGVYHGTARLRVSGMPEAPITIRGVTGAAAARPVFDARGLDTSGRGAVPRAALQIEGAYLVIEHLEFTNARNGENAAGIRLLDSTNAVVRDCKVSRCDMGIFGGDRETVTIEDCEVAFNGTDKFNGYSHNFYMHGNRVVVRRCHIHDALFGQNYKSRAHANELWFNWITDSNEGEVGCVDAVGATDRPNSNTLLVGNVLVSRPDRGGNTAKYVLFGAESGGKHQGTLFLFRNTFVAGDPRITFITLADPQARAVIQNNVFLGSQRLLDLPQPPISVSVNHNLLPKGAPVPPGWTGTPSSGGPFRYTDGDGKPHTLNL